MLFWVVVFADLWLFGLGVVVLCGLVICCNFVLYWLFVVFFVDCLVGVDCCSVGLFSCLFGMLCCWWLFGGFGLVLRCVWGYCLVVCCLLVGFLWFAGLFCFVFFSLFVFDWLFGCFALVLFGSFRFLLLLLLAVGFLTLLYI